MTTIDNQASLNQAAQNQDTLNAYRLTLEIRESSYPRIKAFQVFGFSGNFFAFLQSDIETDELSSIGISIAWIVCLLFNAPIFTQLQTYMDLLRETSGAAFVLFWSVVLIIQLLGSITGSLLWRRSSCGIVTVIFVITAWVLNGDLGLSLLGGYSLAMAAANMLAVVKLNFKIAVQDIARD